MKGDFGVCLQGTHPDLTERTEHDSNLAKTIHNSVIKHEVYHVRHDTHPYFQSDCSDPVTQVDIGEKFQTSDECCRILHCKKSGMPGRKLH